MTNAELIAKLQQLPAGDVVVLEGSEWTHLAGDAVSLDGFTYILKGDGNAPDLPKGWQS